MVSARAYRRTAHWRRTVTIGIYAGWIAGASFALAEMVAMAVLRISPLQPWRAFASMVGGRAALEAWPLPVAFAVGFVVHAAIAAFWGVIYNALIGARLGTQSNAQAMAGVMFGLVVWVVDFFLLATLFWPWFLRANLPFQALVHAAFYGLPLGLATAAFWVRAPVRRPRAV